MKIAVLTIHVGFNFGSVLQTVATSKFLLKFADEVEVVNYVPARTTIKRYFINAIKIKKLIRKIILFPEYLYNRYIYGHSLRKYCKLSKPIYGREGMLRLPQFDYYVTGSDQVWNSIHNEGLDKLYYWDFLSPTAKRIALSSSFGREDIDAEEKTEVKTLLSPYQAISVREKSAKHIVESMGLQATHLFDPTFFLSKEDWKVYMPKRKIKESYLLVYVPYNIVSKAEIYRVVRSISEKKHLKVVTFSWNYKKEPLADKTIRYASPLDFLSLMNYADYIVTNSFHGTAFSINLNKDFCVFMPSGFGTRILSILESCHLEDRLLTNYSQTNKVCDTIDYSPVNIILEGERQKAYDFMKQVIAG